MLNVLTDQKEFYEEAQDNKGGFFEAFSKQYPKMIYID